MTTPHRATPEQWASIEAGIRTYPGQWPGQWGDCVLELRARVEALEATQHWHIGRQGQPTPAEPPPLGLMPRWLADERRLADLDAALQRYKDANLQPPHQWLSERQDLLIALRCRQEAKPAAWRPLEVEITYGSEPASDEPISMATAQQILSPRMVEGTFEHGGETYQFRANPERPAQPAPIATDQELQKAWNSVPGEGFIAALRAVYDLGRQHGAAQATCPHIVSSDEGTSYCRLAEQAPALITPMDELRAASAEARPGGLVEGVADVLLTKAFTADDPVGARAVLRRVAQWIRGLDPEPSGIGRWLGQLSTPCTVIADLLEQEADR